VVQANLGKQLTARTKGTGGVPQVVKDLLWKCKPLSSKKQTHQKKKITKTKKGY
jgi:hypothetical protein